MKITVRLLAGALCAITITSCANGGGSAGRTLDALFRTFGLVAKADVPAANSDEAVLQRGRQIEQRGTYGVPATQATRTAVVQR